MRGAIRAKTDVALAIAHDDEALHAVIGGALLHLAQVFPILRLVHEEGVHVFESLDLVLGGDLGEIEIVDLARAQVLDQRPLGERDAEEGFLGGEKRTTGKCKRTGRG